MGNKIFHYKGYACMPEFDFDSHVICGEILGINDIVTFSAEKPSDVERKFHDAVDNYIQFCKEVGKEPEKP